MAHIAKIQAALKTHGLDAVLLTSSVNQRYATGFDFTDGAVVVGLGDARLLTDSRYVEAAEKANTGAQVRCTAPGTTLNALISQALADAGARRVGIEAERLSLAAFRRYEGLLPLMELIACDEIFTQLRASKTPEELASMRAAQAIAERALEDILGLLRPGLTEREVAAELTYRMLRYGGEGNSFPPIVVTGANSSMPHGVPGDTVIQKGDFVTMDFGTIKDGYCSDMTRTVAIGSATEEMRTVYQVVLEAQLAGIAAARAGIPGRDVDAAARAVIEKAGYGPYFGHGFGHSLGLEIHEPPNFNPSGETLLPVGAVVSAEPGIYLPGRFGVRIEDVVVLTTDGCEILTKAPKELLIL